MLRFLGSGLDAQQLALISIYWVISITIAITVHEYAHAWRAWKAGDMTARNAGRMSLYPWVHYDPIGTTLFLLLGFGWAKPVPVNHFAFRRPRQDAIMVGLWGPLSNLIVACVVGLPFRLGLVTPDWTYAGLLEVIVRLNLALALFNLIPVPPLDGSHVLSGLLPIAQARKLDEFYARYSMMLLLGVIFFARPVLIATLSFMAWVLTGLQM